MRCFRSFIVDDGKPLLNDIQALRFHGLKIGFVGREPVGGKNSGKALSMKGADYVIHQLNDTRVSVRVARQQFGFGIASCQPIGDRLKLGQCAVLSLRTSVGIVALGFIARYSGVF